MKLVRLVYASRFATSITTKDLQNILDASRAKNPDRGITGALCYSPGCFLQVLEGPSKAVNELYRKIVMDDRNQEVSLLSYERVDERLFYRWAMAYISTQSFAAEVSLRFGSMASFDPFAMNAPQAIGFMLNMIELQSERDQELP